ncbi:MAG: glycosyltransferase [Bacteroidales bacterium]|nr:glycosyltransferase [Bacteroidales bacterium]
MKILFVIDTLGSGGKERRLTELLKALKSSKEIDFELAVMSNDIHYSEIYDLGITIHRIIRKTKKDIFIFRKFYLLIRQYKPDAVHCWESMTAVYLAPVCRMLRCPLINGMVTNVPLRRNIFNRHWFRARLTFPFSEKIVCNSEAGIEAYRVPRSKGVVIHNGFNFVRSKNLIQDSEIREELHIFTRFIIGMVASFWKQKDYPTYYKAAQILLDRRNDITFLAIGPNTDSEQSVRLVEEKNRAGFRFLGKRTGIESYVNAMDVCVLSTFTEGFSNAIIEYMALGKPVIATSGGGTPELVMDGITGFLVPPKNPEVMAERMEKLIDENNLRKEMGEAGKEHIKTRFSIDRMAGRYLDLYKEVAHRNGKLSIAG